MVAIHMCVDRWIDNFDKDVKQSVMNIYRQKKMERKENYLKQSVRSLKLSLEKVNMIQLRNWWNHIWYD